MRRCLKILFIPLTLALVNYSVAQCVAISFESKSSACLEEQLLFRGPEGFSEYEWDFSSGDLEANPSTSTLFNSSAYGFAHTVEVIYDNGQYYGFFLSRASRKLFRMNFGTSLENSPTFTDLGGLGINLDSWRTIRIKRESGNYYGFLIGNNSIYRTTFGELITNQPTSAELLTSNLVAPFDVAVEQTNSGDFLFIVGLGNNRITRLSIPSLASHASAILNDEIVVTGASILGGISFINECGQSYALVTSLGDGKLFKLNFGQNLSASPSVVEVNLGIAMQVPGSVAVAHDNSNVYAFIQANSNVLYRVNFGNSINGTGQLSQVTTGIETDLFGFSIHKVNSKWVAFASENSGSRMFRLTFLDNNLTTDDISQQKDPTTKALSSGQINVTLRIKDANDIWTSVMKSITISSHQAPDISINSTNNCANHDVFFSIESSANLSEILWDFGDQTQTSNNSTPTHQFAAPGIYSISVNVKAANACENSAIRIYKIYEQPNADFVIPDNLFCTNNQYSFLASTPDHYDDQLSYEWYVNNALISSDRDLLHQFTQSGQYELKFVTSIPGCSSEQVQNVNEVYAGPSVDFLFTGTCESDTFVFTNETIGSVIGFTWDFGDSQTSNSEDALHEFSGPGNYTVVLNAINEVGCNNKSERLVTVYSSPQPDFAALLPPFSCSGTPTQINDLTPNPTDSNLSSWSWNFGDPQSSQNTSTARNPQHTYANAGQYTVQLTVTTNFGCQASTSKAITVAQSPSTAFTTSPLCRDVGVTFQTTDPSITGWHWTIGSSNYFFNDPVHVFVNAGSYPVQLVATAANNCVGATSSFVNIQPPITPSFSFEKNCVGTPTRFNDLTSSPNDPVVSRHWEFGTTDTATGIQALHTFASPGSQNVTLRVTTTAGCTYTRSQSVAVVPAPVANFTASPNIGAPPLSVQFTNTSQNASSFLWNFNDAAEATSIATSPQHTFTEIGTYAVDLTASNSVGCSHTTTKLIQTLLPVVNISLSSLRTEQSNGLGTTIRPVVTITNRGNVPAQNVRITFDVAGQTRLHETIDATIAPGATYQHITGFTLEQTRGLDFICAELTYAANTADDTRNCVTIEDRFFLNHPYPNPVRDQLNIEWVGRDQQAVSVAIHNAIGKVIYTNTYASTEGFNRIIIPVITWATGIHVVTITSSDSRKTFQIVVR